MSVTSNQRHVGLAAASPRAKQRAAALIDGVGGRHVGGAVMTSVPPCRIKVPLAGRQAWVASLADEGLFGPKGTKEFARNPGWRIEADRILARIKSTK